MPEPEEGASQELNPETPNTTPDTPAVEDNTADLAAAKVAELTLALAAKDQRIAELTAEVQAAKAANYDLLMATPAGTETTDENDADNDDELDNEDVSIDDILYAKE